MVSQNPFTRTLCNIVLLYEHNYYGIFDEILKMKNYTFIGIGASAGGLHAFEELIPLLPINEHFVYIIAQHLDAHKESALSEILSHYTTMPIAEITQGCLFLPNHIYIIPAGFNLIFKNKNLILQTIETYPRTATPSIDKLFTSLASYKHDNCVGIVLSGTGHDGTKGLEEIKKSGGITIAQEPKEADFSSMPQSAIESENIDYILTTEQIAKSIPSLIFTKNNALVPTEEALNSPLNTIKKLLLEKESLDINKYKHETIMRRIQKRMDTLNMPTIEEYLFYITTHHDELHTLYQKILVSVTDFFRDKKAFESLKEQLFIYLEDKPQDYELRLWSIACATGEEAYSFAILVAQISQELNKKFNLHIFATDIDEAALAKARKGSYPSDSLKNIDASIVKEYFVKSHNSYKIIESIRKTIVFTNHNILNDPPFINQDFISCRNFLIYILPSVQQSIFQLCNYSLKDNGILFLGSSESVLISSKYFTALDGESKIYKKEKLKTQLQLSPHYFSQHLKGKNPLNPQTKGEETDKSIEKQIAEKVFDFFAPNCVLIDKEYSIIYKKGSLPFINLSDGFVSLNLINNIDKTLRYDIQIIIKNAFASKTMQESHFIELQLSDKEQNFIKIIAHPFEVVNASLMVLLYFQELSTADIQFHTTTLKNDSFMLENLTTQLKQVQADNYALSNELLLNKENMQLLNEELQSSNEELQSSNEELETSNEELQSSNEELHLSINNEQRTQEKLSDILNATQDGIIGLDLEGKHTFVNEAAVQLLGFSYDELIGTNAHRLWHHTKADGSHYPISDCLLHNGLMQGTRTKIKDLFWKKDGSSLEVEVFQSPIIHNNNITGAVLSFHDITQENILKKELLHQHSLAEHYLNIAGTLVMQLDIYGNIVIINEEGCKLLGLKKSQALGKNFIDNFVPSEIRNQVKDVFHSVVSGDYKMSSYYKNPIIDAHKQEHMMSWINHFIKDSEGNIIGLITSGTDITQTEKLSAQLQKQEELYKLTFEEADIGIAHVSLDGRWVDTNEYMSTLLGYTKQEFQNMHVAELTYTDDTNTDKKMIQKLLTGDTSSYHIEKRYLHKNGNIVWVNVSVVLLEDNLLQPMYFLKIIRDITQLKLLMYEVEKEKNRFQKIIEFVPTPILIYSGTGQVISINKIFKEMTGYSQKELSNIKTFIHKLFPDEDANTLFKLQEYYNNPIIKEVQEQTLTTKSSQKRAVILNAVALNEAQEKQDQIYIIAMIDMTDMQEKDELMIAQSRQAVMGEMLSMIAHQWRQPLSVISMVANNLQANIELEEKITNESLANLIATISTQTAYLSHTVDDFRNFFKPDTKKEDINIQEVLQKIKSLIMKSLDNNNIRLELSIIQNINIVTYPNQLIQVLINIINNAKDALIEKKPSDAFIKIDLIEENDELILSICDNGGGIKASVKNKLGQAYVSSKSKNGTGLGLYMSMIIVNKHLDGRLYWESDEKGACFYVALPLEYVD